jgi:tripartite ATP-independent transporter DctM subunit
MHVSVGDLFVSAVVPGFMLVGAYILYILYYSYTHKEYDLRVPSNKSNKELFYQTMVAVVPALPLIVSVLGSIFSGLATPTESASIGVVGALLLALFKRKLTFDTIKTSTLDSVKMSGMIFMILVGATAFSLVFNELGGSDIVLEFFEEDIESKWVFVALSMIVIFVLGFFLDFIEISFIVVPILTPIVATLGIDPIWFAILIALNLQTSFLTPPFGFALFFLKGAVGELVNIKDIYKGVIPFIIIQLIVLLLIIIFPSLLLL